MHTHTHTHTHRERERETQTDRHIATHTLDNTRAHTYFWLIANENNDDGNQ